MPLKKAAAIDGTDAIRFVSYPVRAMYLEAQLHTDVSAGAAG